MLLYTQLFTRSGIRRSEHVDRLSAGGRQNTTVSTAGLAHPGKKYPYKETVNPSTLAVYVSDNPPIKNPRLLPRYIQARVAARSCLLK